MKRYQKSLVSVVILLLFFPLYAKGEGYNLSKENGVEHNFLLVNKEPNGCYFVLTEDMFTTKESRQQITKEIGSAKTIAKIMYAYEFKSDWSKYALFVITLMDKNDNEIKQSMLVDPKNIDWKDVDSDKDIKYLSEVAKLFYKYKSEKK